MEEENLNVDDYVYKSINNDKELLNLSDGSIIKRIKESHTLTNGKLYVIHDHCIKNDKGNFENVSCYYGCCFKLATLKEPLFSYPEYWYAKVTDELIDAYNEAIKDTTLKSISQLKSVGRGQWLYFMWCRREDAWQKDDKDKYYINATDTRNDIPTYCKCITTEEAVKFFEKGFSFVQSTNFVSQCQHANYWWTEFTPEVIAAYRMWIHRENIDLTELPNSYEYFQWCKKEDSCRDSSDGKYHVNVYNIQEIIANYCIYIKPEEAVQFFNNNAKFINNNSTNNLKIQDYGKTVIKVDRLVSTVKRGNKPSGTTITGKSSKSTIASRPISYETSIIKS